MLSNIHAPVLLNPIKHDLSYDISSRRSGAALENVCICVNWSKGRSSQTAQ